MRCERRIPLSIGGVDVRLLRYHVLPPLPPGALSPRKPKLAGGEGLAGGDALDW